MKKLLAILFICICFISCSRLSPNIRIYKGYIVQYEPGDFWLCDQIIVKADNGKLLETTAKFKEDPFEDNSLIIRQYIKDKTHIEIVVSGDSTDLANYGIIPIK